MLAERASALRAAQATAAQDADLRPILETLRDRSLREIAMELTNRNIPTPRGGHPPRKFPGLDPIQFSYKIAACANELGADAIFVDAGGVGGCAEVGCAELH